MHRGIDEMVKCDVNYMGNIISNICNCDSPCEPLMRGVLPGVCGRGDKKLSTRLTRFYEL